jgi:hypothetical protein
MSDLKSAWEIAQEKAERLGRLSAEDLRRQREETCRQAGTGIGQRYLDSPETVDLMAELDKHPEQERALVKGAVVKRLAEALQLGSEPRTGSGAAGQGQSDTADLRLEKTVDAIAALEPAWGTIIEQIRGLMQEYVAAAGKTQRKQEVEKKGRETLHRLRISGTAVGDINVEAAAQWQQSWQELSQAFAARLDNLKQELLARTSAA